MNLKKCKSLFDAQEYDELIAICEKQINSTDDLVAVRILCSCFIKIGDCDKLDALIDKFKTKEAIYSKLDFERAYADFSQKRPASWFVNLNCSHPKAAMLKSQILYKQQEFYSSAQLMEQSVPKSSDGITNLIAAASRALYTPAAKYLAAAIDTYEHQYNLALFWIGRCKFEEASKALAKATQIFNSSEDKSDKDKNNLRLLSVIIETFSGQNPFFIPADEPEQIRYYLRVLEKLQTLKLQNHDYASLTELQAQMVEVEKYLHTMESGFFASESGFQQLNAVAKVISNLMSKKQQQKLNFLSVQNFSPLLASNVVFAVTCQGALPSIQAQRRYKKIPQQFEQYQQAKMQQLPVKNIDLKIVQQFDKPIIDNLETMLKAVNAYGDIGIVNSQKSDLIVLKSQKFSIIQKIKLDTKQNADKSEIQLIHSVIQRIKKPMPLKWQKKIKKGKKVQQHQGQYVGDKNEVSNVIVKKPQKKPGRK